MFKNNNILIIALVLVSVFSANGQTFVVNSESDIVDNNTADGICDTGNVIDGNPECTLRAAIQEVNQAVTPAIINFDISGCTDDICTITIDRVNNGNLPDIVKQVIIDGSSQPNNSTVCTNSIETRDDYKIVIQGDGLDIGLRLEDGSDNSIIRGLNISNFFNNVVIAQSDSNVIECNFIGTDPSGMTSSGNNAANGVIFVCDSTNNIIGGVDAEDGNLIAGHNVDGVQFFSGFCTPETTRPFDNAVLGNYIGTNKLATTTLNNTFGGISFFGAGGVHDNYIGTLQDGTTINGNIIGGSESGIFIDEGSSGITILGNYIGTDKTGSIDLGNEFGGIDIISGNENDIGSATSGQGNNIAFNSVGVFVSGGPTSINNRIRGNGFHDNLNQSIDIIVDGGSDPDGFNTNDSDDMDVGANNLMNHPDIISVTLNDTNDFAAVDVNFMVDATTANPSYPITIDAYFSEDADTKQGRFYLGSKTYITPQSLATESFTLPVGLSLGHLLLSATDDNGNTSELVFPY